MSMSKPSELYHYVSLTSQPLITDELTLKLALQDALTATFGLVYAGAPIDIVSMSSSEEGSEGETVIRVSSGDVKRIMAAVTAYNAPGRSRLSIVKDALIPPNKTNSMSISETNT